MTDDPHRDEELAELRRMAEEAPARGNTAHADELEKGIRDMERLDADLAATERKRQQALAEYDDAGDMGKRTGHAVGTGMAVGCLRVLASAVAVGFVVLSLVR